MTFRIMMVLFSAIATTIMGIAATATIAGLHQWAYNSDLDRVGLAAVGAGKLACRPGSNAHDHALTPNHLYTDLTQRLGAITKGR
ncbi:hypothetical protein GTZ99_11570 [Novosphingobium sp. FSY-8]|uniref:Uncharacterized protein n=1 Tax=Novosphingobium ovatum TaxID=1908523 RepID=A0ABW9XF78_9SPHN|nr:hypothetical protein [Novosphingobium ovatum]NBC37197.1 hypothetical protein [Novosphingobium ovatum]